MPPKKQVQIQTTPVKAKTSEKTVRIQSEKSEVQSIIQDAWKSYQSTPTNLRLIDVFMLFLMLSGITQFIYCVLVGNYPFNAFLAGFSSTVGQFVLLAGLRSQCNPANAHEFPSVTPER